MCLNLISLTSIVPGPSSPSLLPWVSAVVPLNHVPFCPVGGVGGPTRESVPRAPWGASSWRAGIAPPRHIVQEEVVNHSSA